MHINHFASMPAKYISSSRIARAKKRWIDNFETSKFLFIKAVSVYRTISSTGTSLFPHSLSSTVWFKRQHIRTGMGGGWKNGVSVLCFVFCSTRD
jgi:hypothetical protein